MKKFLLATCASLAVALAPSAPLSAQEAVTSEEAVAAKTAATPALWMVADEDTTIYIFGTVHALPADIDWYSGPVKDALDGSKSLVTEIDMTPESTAAIGPAIIAKASLPEGETLRGMMSDEQRVAYEAGLGKIGIPAAALDRFEPWFAAITVAQVMMQAAGFDGANGVEKVLEATVPEGTERVALETVEYQLDIFDTLPMDKQIPYLLEALRDPQAGITMLNGMIEEWKVGDVDDLGKMLQEGADTDTMLMERLFYIRNANWAEWIDERLEQPGEVFMAVGAGHLAGEKSVQDYLAERDIEVTRIQ